MNFQQPKPDSIQYSDLIYEIQKGIIKIPKFQREFVWNLDETAELLDSILKGYPIGTFIFWQTDERMNDVKNVGNLKIPDTPDRNQSSVCIRRTATHHLSLSLLSVVLRFRRRAKRR